MTDEEVRIHNEVAASLRKRDQGVMKSGHTTTVKIITFLIFMVPIGIMVNCLSKGPTREIVKSAHDVVSDFDLVYGQCSELAKKNVKYPSSFQIDDPRIIESKQEFKKGNGIDVAFTAQNSYGTRIAGTVHCSVEGTTLSLDSMKMEGE
jgi:hypothetical protein